MPATSWSRRSRFSWRARSRRTAISFKMAVELPVFGLSRLRMTTDGAGITTLVGCLGCPLDCKWCLNPHARLADTRHARVSPERLVELLEQDSIYFSATGGGVTFGGGEALLHAAFIRAFREVCPADWRIAVETSLNVSEENARLCLDCVDEWIVDIKDMNPDIYARYTGASPEKRDANLRLLAENCPQRTDVRVPRIPGYNAETDVERSVEQLRQMGFSRFDRFEYVDPKCRNRHNI